MPPGTLEKILAQHTFSIYKQQGHNSGPRGWDKLVHTGYPHVEMPATKLFICL